jgi:hypothetical protein
LVAVNVIRIAAVNQDVTGLQMRHDARDGFIHGSSGNHQPDGARLVKLLGEILQGGRSNRFLFD